MGFRVSVFVARHYWHDGDSATWRSSEHINREVYREIRARYATLKSARPRFERIGDYDVVYNYVDATDRFGRGALEFAAAVFEGRHDRELAERVAERLNVADKTELNFDIEWTFPVQESEKKRQFEGAR